MYFLCGSFNVSKPLIICVFCSKQKKVEFIPIFQKTGIKLAEALINKAKITEILENHHVVVPRFKSFIIGFGLDYHKQHLVYDIGLPDLPHIPSNKAQLILTNQLKDLIRAPKGDWQRILANAQFVYRALEEKGFYNSGKLYFPKYDLTYSGRSKCTNNNIQGAGDNDDIYSATEDNCYFIHFDWIAADFRAASLMSGDRVLCAAFKESDPYTALHAELNDPDISRADCKKRLFGSLYSLNTDGLDCYPELSEWMKSEIKLIEKYGYGESIIGRRFYIEEGRTIKSAFNAKMQGSVAHAMQSAMYEVFKVWPDKILTEVHDSLIMTCNKDEIEDIIESVSKIMLRPLSGWLNSNPKFPLKVSIGKKWRQWKLYKEFR